MSNYTALLNANVLCRAPMRDLLIQLALTDIFKAKWSEDICLEWISALMRNEPHRNRTALERTRDLTNQATRDSLVTSQEAKVPSLEFPDPDDRHVLAAAIVGRCDVIVTQYLKVFPEGALEPYGIETLHPDGFRSNNLALTPSRFCSALHKVRSRLEHPPYIAEDHLAILTRQGPVATAAELAQFREWFWRTGGGKADPFSRCDLRIHRQTELSFAYQYVQSSKQVTHGFVQSGSEFFQAIDQ